MKKKLAMLCLVTVSVAAMVCGCGKSTSAATTNSVATESTASESEAKTISPLSPSVDMDQLDDCTVHGQFTADDFNWMNGTLALSIFDEINFDSVEVSQLKVGDTIDTGNGEVVVKSIRDIDGGKVINEGEGDELTLVAPEDSSGIFQIVRENDAVDMQIVGQAELALSENVVLHDCTDNPGETVEVSHDKIKGHMESLDDAHNTFSEHSTTVTIENGEITEITHNWTP